ncbi:MAG: hypothetical protein P4L74_06650 [Candidatus Doudnabacteria bacterium]|nr:hypothetical protein [Candidatus Doudnabacteria bacterium]
MTDNKKNILCIAFLVLVGAIFYFATLKAVPGFVDLRTGLPNNPAQFGGIGPFESSHERSSYAMVLSMLDYHTVSLPKPLADFGSPDVGYYNGKFYSFFPPGVAAMAYPFYILGEHWNLPIAFAYFSMCIAAILALAMLFIICRDIFGFSAPLSLLVVFILGFGTIFLNYSITLYQHIPTIFLMFVSYYSVWKFRKGGKFAWLWAAAVWACYGLGPIFDYPNLILMLPILGYFFASAFSLARTDDGLKIGLRNSFVASLVVLLLLGVAQIYYNRSVFGNWRIYSNALPRYDQTLGSPDLSNAATQAITRQKESVASVFSEKNLPLGFYILTVSVDKGLFVYMPIFVLAILGMYAVRKKMTLEIWTLLAICALNLILYSSFGDPWGGLSYGPRYLLPAIAVLPVFIGFWIQSLGKRRLWGSAALFALFAYSSAVSLLGAVTRNVVFPKPEALYADTSNKFWFNARYLKLNQSGSFAYNEFFSGRISLTEYYLILFAAILILMLALLLLIPKYEYGD